MVKAFTSHILRWMAGCGLLGLAIWMVKRGDGALGSGTMAVAIFSVCCLAMAGLFFFPDGRRLFMAPFLFMAERLYFPGGKLDKPVLSYDLPDYYRKQRRYVEALERYEIIVEHYPDEIRAWRGAIEVLGFDLGDPERAAKLLGKAQRRFRNDFDKLEQLRGLESRLAHVRPPMAAV